MIACEEIGRQAADQVRNMALAVRAGRFADDRQWKELMTDGE